MSPKFGPLVHPKMLNFPSTCPLLQTSCDITLVNKYFPHSCQRGEIKRVPEPFLFSIFFVNFSKGPDVFNYCTFFLGCATTMLPNAFTLASSFVRSMKTFVVLSPSLDLERAPQSANHNTPYCNIIRLRLPIVPMPTFFFVHFVSVSVFTLPSVIKLLFCTHIRCLIRSAAFH